MAEHPKFGSIKSIVSSIICRGLVLEDMHITPATLNSLSNHYADKIIKEFTNCNNLGKDKMNKEYYIERHASGRVGNCLLFWKRDDNGYVCDLKDARIFTEEEASELIEKDGGVKYTAWNKHELDIISAEHVDHQKLRDGMKLN